MSLLAQLFICVWFIPVLSMIIIPLSMLAVNTCVQLFSRKSIPQGQEKCVALPEAA